MEHQRATGADVRAAGIVLLTAAALTVVAMSQHPAGMHGATMLSSVVHAGMMVLLALMFVGFAVVSVQRGLDRLLVIIALTACGVSTFAHVGAATINGFIVPSLAMRPEPPGHDIFLLCWQANQALARLGVYATGIAYLAWSIDLLRGANLANRVIAVSGIAAAVLPALALGAGLLKMNVHGAFLVYTVHAAWAVAVGVQLVRGKLGSAGRAATA